MTAPGISFPLYKKGESKWGARVGTFSLHSLVQGCSFCASPLGTLSGTNG